MTSVYTCKKNVSIISTWQVQEEILKAKSFLTIHKLTRKSLDIESAIEALESAYETLDGVNHDFNLLDSDDLYPREVLITRHLV